MEIKIYEVIRYNREQYPENGDETIYLVRAENHLDAAYLAERSLAFLPHTKARPYADVIYELGIETRVLQKVYPPEVIRGPYYQTPYRRGWKMWWRESPENPWEEWDKISPKRYPQSGTAGGPDTDQDRNTT